MYADRHARPEGIKPGSLIVAIAINAGLIGALVFVTPVFKVIKDKRPFEARNIPLDPPPPAVPVESKPEAKTHAAAQPERVSATTPVVEGPGAIFVLPPPLLPFEPPYPPGEIARVDPPVAPPVLVEARLDPRYARDLQPAYPAGERRAEREGSVTVRVAIGADGRVTAADCVSATSDAFCAATRQQALAKWRFRPALRDGAAVPSNTTLTVRFELES